MDKNIHFLSQKTPEKSPDFFTKKPKNSFKKKWGFYAFPALVLVVVIWYGGYIRLFATGTGIAPNTVLDPSCAPGDDGCYVQILPVQSSTSSAGKILGSDGSNTIWVDQNGGIFPSAGTAVTATGWAAVQGRTLGSTSTTLAQFIQNVFFPTHTSTTTTMTDYLANSTKTQVGGDIDSGHAATSTTNPTIASFAISTATSSSPTGCTTSGGSLTGCDQISSNINLAASWTVQSGTSTSMENYTDHNWYVLTQRSLLLTSTDGGPYVLTTASTTGTVDSTSACTNTDTYGGCTVINTLTADNGDGTNSTQNTTHTSAIGSPVTANNISSIQVSIQSHTSGHSDSIDGSSSPTSLGSISNPKDIRTIAATADNTSNGTGSTYVLTVNGSITQSVSTAFAGLKSYIFADVVGKDYSTITTTSTAAFSALASTACGTTGFNCYVSAAGSATREADFNSVFGKNVWYAYPKTLGAEPYTSLTTGMKVSTDDGASYPHNNEFSQSDIFLTNGGGVSTEYYLYGFDYSAGFGGIGSTDAWIKYP